MLSGISNPFGTEMQAASAVICTSIGLLAGRKFCLAAACKLVGTLEGWVGMQNADAWHQAGDEYMAMAKKDRFRDAAAVAGFVGAVALARYAEKSLTVKEEPKPEEPGYFQNYAMPTIKYGTVFGIGLAAKPVAEKFKGTDFAKISRNKLGYWNFMAEGKGFKAAVGRMGLACLGQLPGKYNDGYSV